MTESENCRSPPTIAGEYFDYDDSNKPILNSIRLSLPVKCNLQCIYCYSNAGEETGKLNFKEILGLIKEAKSLGAKNVIIVGRGEPLLYDRIFELLKFIDETKMASLIFTNGTLITKDIARKLFKYNTSIFTKLNSFNEKTQNLLCGCNQYKKIVEGLHNLMKTGFNKTEPSRLGIDSIICKQNIKEIPTLFRFCRENNIIPKFETVTIKGRAKNHDLKPEKEELKKVVNTLLEVDEKEYEFSWKPGLVYIATKSNPHAKSCFVDEDRFVYPSTASDRPAGNLLKTSLKAIVQSSKFNEIKKTDKHFRHIFD